MRKLLITKFTKFCRIFFLKWRKKYLQRFLLRSLNIFEDSKCLEYPGHNFRFSGEMISSFLLWFLQV